MKFLATLILTASAVFGSTLISEENGIYFAESEWHLSISTDDFAVECTKTLSECREFDFNTETWEVTSFSNFSPDLQNLFLNKLK